MTAAVEITNLRYHYPDGTPALEGINLQIEAGVATGILGPNGAGKSTLLLHLVGLCEPAAGEILIGGERLTRASARALRRRVGIVFQDPDDMLFLPRVGDDVAFGPRNLGLPENEVDARVRTSLAAVGLAGFENRAPHHMSLGEKRRASLACVLAMQPEVLLLDEPTANLDGRGRRQLATTLAAIGRTQIIASHDLDFVRRQCPITAVLQKGRMAAGGPTTAVLADESRLRDWGLI